MSMRKWYLRLLTRQEPLNTVTKHIPESPPKSRPVSLTHGRRGTWICK